MKRPSCRFFFLMLPLALLGCETWEDVLAETDPRNAFMYLPNLQGKPWFSRAANVRLDDDYTLVVFTLHAKDPDVYGTTYEDELQEVFKEHRYEYEANGFWRRTPRTAFSEQGARYEMQEDGTAIIAIGGTVPENIITIYKGLPPVDGILDED